MNPISNELALAPLGAGDLIDRAVRLYRRQFLTLIRIATPPVLVSALGSTMVTIAFRELSSTSSELRLVMYVFVFAGGLIVTFCGSLFSLIVMGGATRNLVAHLVWNEPVTARTTYRAVKERFWGLLGASILVALWLAFAAIIASMGYAFLSFIMVMVVAVGASLSPLSAKPGRGLGTVASLSLALIVLFLPAGPL